MLKEVNSNTYTLESLFTEKYDVDFYQREYVWQTKQVEDLVNDLSNEFLRHWKPGDTTDQVKNYDPYFMGEIVLSIKGDGRNAIIDGQQRLTTFTLLLIYLKNTFGTTPGFPTKIESLIYSDDYGTKRFNLEIPERKKCMLSLYENGKYKLTGTDSVSVENLLSRYNDFCDIWPEDINDSNVSSFAYWLMGKVIFSKVWTNSDEFAYVIFETMNDRGLSLSQIEMLRSYLLANIIEDERDEAIKLIDDTIRILKSVNHTSKSKAEFEFFKVFFRSHLAQDMSQTNKSSDFIRIGNEFHRWISDNNMKLGLVESSDYKLFIERLNYFAKAYRKINELIYDRNSKEFFYLIVNSDYGFTLQVPAILASIKYMDNSEEIEMKIRLISKYLTKVLTWRVWNHFVISQSSMEASIYDFCLNIREKSNEEIEAIILANPLNIPKLENAPTLNQQNKNKIKVLLAIITEIVSDNSKESNYLLNEKSKKDPIEVEHIWSNHFDQHVDEFSDETSFSIMRNNIGGLLLLPKSFNSSYNDNAFEEKVHHYFGQNILAQTLNEKKYINNPGFSNFINTSKLPFKSYDTFTKDSIVERANLYREILEWNWSN